MSALGVVERGRSGPSGGVSGKKKELLRLVFEVLITKSHTVLCDLGDLGALDISCFDFCKTIKISDFSQDIVRAL